jgi:hypothetical protein
MRETWGEMRNAYGVLMGKVGEKSVLERRSDSGRQKQGFYFCLFLRLRSVGVR